MAENTEEKLVKSEAFPNIQVSEKFNKKFDDTLNAVKDYAKSHPQDKGANEFVTRLNNLSGYTIHDGSIGDRDCTGAHNSNSKNINIPFTLSPSEGGTGKYHGSNGNNFDVTFDRSVIHELAHATGMDRNKTSITSKSIEKLLNEEAEFNTLRQELGVRTSPMNAQNLPKFPSGALHEAGAVEVENYIASQVFHDNNRRMNVTDRKLDAEKAYELHETLKDWQETDYLIHGQCKNGNTLKREKSSDNGQSLLKNDLRDTSSNPNSLSKLGANALEERIALAAQFIQTLPEQQQAIYAKAVADYANQNGINVTDQQPEMRTETQVII